jgi:hypothetical protein
MTSKNATVSEQTLPIAMALYITRPGIEVHPWNTISTWKFINGLGTNRPQQTVRCLFSDAVAAFLMGEVGDYYGDWVGKTLEEVTNSNNGSIIKTGDVTIKNRPIVVISQSELDMLVADGLMPVDYTPDIT